MAGVSSDKSNARVAALRQMLDGEPDSLAIVDHDRGNTPAWNAEIHEDERNIQPFDVVHKLRIHLPGNDHTIDIPFEQKARDGEFFFLQRVDRREEDIEIVVPRFEFRSEEYLRIEGFCAGEMVF
jgi:hypothetical protein